eukprot:3730046-Pyramimonas_sp.AAC.1
MAEARVGTLPRVRSRRDKRKSPRIAQQCLVELSRAQQRLAEHCQAPGALWMPSWRRTNASRAPEASSLRRKGGS